MFVALIAMSGIRVCDTELLELGVSGLGGVAVISDEAADDGAVFLFDVGLIIFVIGTRAREVHREFALGQIPPQVVVEELAAVVAIKTQQDLARGIIKPKHYLNLLVDIA